MYEMKFKTGDKVRILDGANIEPEGTECPDWTPGMSKLVGKVMTVEAVDATDATYSLDGCFYWFSQPWLTAADDDTPVTEEKPDEYRPYTLKFDEIPVKPRTRTNDSISIKKGDVVEALFNVLQEEPFKGSLKDAGPQVTLFVTLIGAKAEADLFSKKVRS